MIQKPANRAKTMKISHIPVISEIGMITSANQPPEGMSYPMSSPPGM